MKIQQFILEFLVILQVLISGGSGAGGGVGPSLANNAVNKYDKLVAAPDENAEHHETSPKPIIRSNKEKRPNKMHHANKGKQQRDRRKLREKRRSTGKKNLQFLKYACHIFLFSWHLSAWYIRFFTSEPPASIQRGYCSLKGRQQMAQKCFLLIGAIFQLLIQASCLL